MPITKEKIKEIKRKILSLKMKIAKVKDLRKLDELEEKINSML